jgi:hypothetical protein
VKKYELFRCNKRFYIKKNAALTPDVGLYAAPLIIQFEISWVGNPTHAAGDELWM